MRLIYGKKFSNSGTIEKFDGRQTAAYGKVSTTFGLSAQVGTEIVEID